jgi:hypothetical protein
MKTSHGSSIGRALVSKTKGRRFDSCPCRLNNRGLINILYFPVVIRIGKIENLRNVHPDNVVLSSLRANKGGAESKKVHPNLTLAPVDMPVSNNLRATGFFIA